MPLKHLQACSINRFLKKTLPVFDHSVSKEILLNVQSNTPLVQL